MTPSLTELTRIFTRIGLMSFGGPAAQIAVMHKELVEDRPWLSEQQFLNALSFCMLLPGPEAMQLCTYSGWRLRGVLGGLIAGLLFVVPGAIVMLILAIAYANWSELPLAAALFLGVKATVVVVVAQALWRLAHKTLKRVDHWVVAVASFTALYGFATPFPLVIAVAGIYGLFNIADNTATALSDQVGNTTKPAHLTPSFTKTASQGVIWLVLWWTPIGIAYLLGATALTEIGVFFSKLAVVSFGGAYAVLAYMAQEAVTTHGWLTPAQMIDGLGLAETTPGPLILVTEFVGFMAGAGLGGIGFALLAAAMTLWATFAPCFLWIFVAAPHVEWLTTRPRLTTALGAITAAVVGVIANLSLWFALHVVFDSTYRPSGVLTPTFPDLNSINLLAVAFVSCSAFMLLKLHVQLPLTLVFMATAGVLSSLLLT